MEIWHRATPSAAAAVLLAGLILLVIVAAAVATVKVKQSHYRLGGPEGSRRLRLPYFKAIDT